MNARRRLHAIAVMASLSLTLGLFQNCTPQQFDFSSVEMASLTSSSSTLQFETTEDTPIVDKLPAAALVGKSSKVIVTSSPKHGDIKLSPSGEFTYTPFKDFYGTDEFEYSESGSNSGSGPNPSLGSKPSSNLSTRKNGINKKVSIFVRSINDDPWLETDLVNFEMNTGKEFSLLGKDIEDSKIDIVLDSSGQVTSIKTANGTLKMFAPSSFHYTPNSYFRGVDSFEFVLKDSSGATIKKKVSLMVANPFHGLQPALAVRGIGCINCHANVDSAVISDFGKGSPYEIAKHSPFGYDTSAAEFFYTDFHIDMINGGWATSKISGTITVPALTLGFDSKAAMQIILNDYVTWIKTYFPGMYTDAQLKTIVQGIKDKPEYNLSSTKHLKDYIQAVESGKSTPADVVEKSTVFIGAPTAKVILQRAAMSPGEKKKFVKNNQTRSPDLSGITMQPGGYYQNTSGEVICDGDLVIDGTLFLNMLVLKTDDGCRIMATGPIFVQGPITYQRIDVSRTENLTNLQLVSARFISLGVGKTHCETTENPGWYAENPGNLQDPFSQRFDSFGSFTRSTGRDNVLLSREVEYNLAEMNKIVGLKDASCMGGPAPREVNLERLLLNAPRVDSRYTGQFNGVVISEVALFSLSKFSFKYDNVFDRVPVLPILLPDDFLVVK